MCGICGIKLPTSGPIGRYLVDMCQAMRHRGYDSTGFALYGDAVEGQLVVRLRIVEAAHTHAALDALEGALVGSLMPQIPHIQLISSASSSWCPGKRSSASEPAART